MSTQYSINHPKNWQNLNTQSGKQVYHIMTLEYFWKYFTLHLMKISTLFSKINLFLPTPLSPFGMLFLEGIFPHTLRKSHMGRISCVSYSGGISTKNYLNYSTAAPRQSLVSFSLLAMVLINPKLEKSRQKYNHACI